MSESSVVLEPRPGPAGFSDRLFGPGATAAELALVYAVAVLGTALAVLLQALAAPEPGGQAWRALRYAAVALAAFDLIGGMPANATDAAKRWYHRPGRGRLHHLRFVAQHVHPFVAAWLFASVSWADAGAVYAGMLALAVVTVLAPVRLRRPLAFAGVGLALMAVPVLELAAPLAWMAPVLLVKNNLAHIISERSHDGR